MPRHTQDILNRLTDVVRNLCGAVGISPDGLDPAAPRQVHYQDRGVGPDNDTAQARSLTTANQSEADGLFELDVEMADPRSSPTLAVGIQSDVPPPLSESPSPARSEPPATFVLSSPALIPSGPAVDDNPFLVAPAPLPSPASMSAAEANLSVNLPVRPPTPTNQPPVVKLIAATPQTSQEDPPAEPLTLFPTPPEPTASIFGPPLPPIDLDEMAGSQVQDRQAPLSPTVSHPQPAAALTDTGPEIISSRSVDAGDTEQPPAPSTLPPPLPPTQPSLAIPPPRGMMTRSRTRSPSPGPVIGSKRKNDLSGDEGEQKKRRL